MRKAIITGFERFGNYSMNPTEKLVKNIAGTSIANHRITGIVFPTGPLIGKRAVNYGKQIIQLAKRLDASVIISLGIASQVKGVRIEGRAVNWVENDKYCSLEENRQPLVQYELPMVERFVHFGRWDFPNMFRKFSKANIPFEREISQNSGAYCCN